MFEKEAEEYKRNNIYNSKEIRSICIKSIEEAFRDGAVFGYNKANEWHDLRKNPSDLPNDGELVFANNLLDTECVMFRKDKGLGVSWQSDYFELVDVVFWKEIVLPKED